ncbi:hypothetical protein J2T12_000555 [Paenibacillus anaericanus]|uniref:hypothetical protein n=1 Tax=Paenibacillus anaericanus TaxID=170367 RepID=UPI0027891898|nr:hypothetical protein [Paenibacillus anaericanus]MDQ0087161.1 hypothetical protein [Paenibacillus anaericanus]
MIIDSAVKNVIIRNNSIQTEEAPSLANLQAGAFLRVHKTRIPDFLFVTEAYKEAKGLCEWCS